MVVVSYSGKEINAKLVYYGAGLSGKTTNLESIYEAVPETSRGKMVSMKTQSDRTLFFDLLPLDLGEIMGFKTRFLLYTVPGQVFYNATRKLVLKGADAIVFVADSEVGKMEENRESLANLRANLAEYGLSLDQIPWVIQYNKRDLPNVYTVDELNSEINPGGRIPFFEAVATQGKGVFETFRGISHLLMEKVTRDLRRTPPGGSRTIEEPVVQQAAVKLEPARGEWSRFATAAPPAPPAPPARVIAREARETAVPEPAAPVGGLDYGREILLPAEVPSAIPPPAPVVSGEPVTAASAPAAVTRAAASPASAPAPASRPGVSAVPVAEAPLTGAPAAEPRHATLAPEPAVAGSNGDAAQAVSVPEGLTVPVRIPKGATREIVLRIVLTTDE